MPLPDDLDDLLARLRAAPPPADPARVAPALETRVLARIHAGNGTVWFWRWAGVFTLAAATCSFLVARSYVALADESLAALANDGSLVRGLF
ncbi:MAG TPA: hypothetical protein VF178_16015 [Gemmatimonadaceae bacterium]